VKPLGALILTLTSLACIAWALTTWRDLGDPVVFLPLGVIGFVAGLSSRALDEHAKWVEGALHLAAIGVLVFLLRDFGHHAPLFQVATLVSALPAPFSYALARSTHAKSVGFAAGAAWFAFLSAGGGASTLLFGYIVGRAVQVPRHRHDLAKEVTALAAGALIGLFASAACYDLIASLDWPEQYRQGTLGFRVHADPAIHRIPRIALELALSVAAAFHQRTWGAALLVVAASLLALGLLLTDFELAFAGTGCFAMGHPLESAACCVPAFLVVIGPWVLPVVRGARSESGSASESVSESDSASESASDSASDSGS
jgi:hypothetical protein